MGLRQTGEFQPGFTPTNRPLACATHTPPRNGIRIPIPLASRGGTSPHESVFTFDSPWPGRRLRRAGAGRRGGWHRRGPDAADAATPRAQAPSGYQKFIDALAKRLNITSANLETAIGQARTDAGLPAGARLPGWRWQRRARRPGAAVPGVDLNAAATAIGIPTPRSCAPSSAASRWRRWRRLTARRPTDVATALKNAAHTRIDQAVTAGKVAADQAATQKTQVDQRIDQMVNQVMPQGGPGGPAAWPAAGFGGRGGRKT